MPLSSAHPAIVLPLCKLSKKWVSSTALIIGSISPDLEYFFHALPKRTYGHDFFNAWWFNLSITILIAFIFHLIVRNPLIDNLPPFLSQRFIQFKQFNWSKHFTNYFFVIVISAWVGIYSHILWDEFTHKGSFIVESSSFLNIYLITFWQQDFFVYNLMQHLSSFVGTVFVLATLLSFKRNKKAFCNSKWKSFWAIVLFFTFIFILLKVCWISDSFKLNIHYSVMLILCSISSFFISIVFTSLIYSYLQRT